MSRNASAVVRREDAKQAYANIETLVMAKREDVVKTLPRGVDPDHFISVALQAVTRQSKLLECTPGSIVKALRDAAELGLEPSGLMGQAYLVPYKNEARLLPGYRGLIDLAMRSGLVQTIEARVVRERDDFDFEYGTNQHIRHRPYINLTGERGEEWVDERGETRPGKLLDAGDYVAAFARAVLTSGVETFDVMSIAEVNAIRARSQSGSSGPWQTDYAEMARKTIAKRLLKYLPLASKPLQRALEIENAFDADSSTTRLPSATAPNRAALQASILASTAQDAAGPTESDDTAEADTEAADAKPVGPEPGMDGTCGAGMPDTDDAILCRRPPGHRGSHADDEPVSAAENIWPNHAQQETE